MRAAGAVDILYHDGAHVAECARSALAVIQGDTLVTRREGVLESVSMQNLLGLARERMRVEERAITLDELDEADEVLTTGSVRGVVPITAIDGRPVGDGTIGPHARALFTAFAAHVDAYVAARRGGGATGLTTTSAWRALAERESPSRAPDAGGAARGGGPARVRAFGVPGRHARRQPLSSTYGPAHAGRARTASHRTAP
jgi:hypothetical protein